MTISGFRARSLQRKATFQVRRLRDGWIDGVHRAVARLGTKTPLARHLFSEPQTEGWVLHLGAQKTGTTAVQARCRENRVLIERFGVAPVVSQPEIKAFLGRYPVDSDAQAARLRELLERSTQPPHLGACLYSCESNLGSILLPRSPELYPRLNEILPHIERASAHAPRTVLFTIRDYGPLLESAYVQSLKQGKPSSFDEYFDRHAPHLDWRPIVRALRETFGPANTRIYDYDSPRLGQLPLAERVLHDALSVLNAGNINLPPPPAHPRNPRYTDRQVEITAAVLPLLHGREEKKSFKNFVDKLRSPNDQPARFLTEEQNTQLSELYRRHVSELCAEQPLL